MVLTVGVVAIAHWDQQITGEQKFTKQVKSGKCNARRCYAAAARGGHLKVLKWLPNGTEVSNGVNYCELGLSRAARGGTLVEQLPELE